MTLAPFGRRLAEVTGVERIGAYVLVEVADAIVPAPGQFFMLATETGWGGGAGERPYLPRAFSHARVRGGRLSFLLEDIGPGTHRLAEAKPGENLWLTGPLGQGFDMPEGRALLVGGGIGAAPLITLEDELCQLSAVSCQLVLGFRTAEHARAATLFNTEPKLVSDDGSTGRKGLVTELLREEIDADPAATVFACGPPAMLEGVRALCAEREVAAQLALESGMACGFGACFGCVVPTREGYIRVCVEGPVVAAAALETALVPGTGH